MTKTLVDASTVTNLLLEAVAVPPRGTSEEGYVHNRDNTSNSYANQIKDLLSAPGLIQHITAPIHRYDHCLDLMLTRGNSSPHISNITIHPGLSDHYAIIHI